MRKSSLIPAVALGLAACAAGPGYTRTEVVYADSPVYEYVVPVDRVVVVTREALVTQGWVVYRIERSGPNRVIWARRGDADVVRIFATPSGERVAVRGLWEERERGDRGKHRGWKRRGPPLDVMAAIDLRLRRGR